MSSIPQRTFFITDCAMSGEHFKPMGRHKYLYLPTGVTIVHRSWVSSSSSNVYHSKCLDPWYGPTEELLSLYLSRYWASESWTARFEFCLDCKITLARWGNLFLAVVVLLIVARVKRKKAKQEFVWTGVRIWISSRFRLSNLYINDLMISIQVSLPLGAQSNWLYLECPDIG